MASSCLNVNFARHLRIRSRAIHSKSDRGKTMLHMLWRGSLQCCLKIEISFYPRELFLLLEGGHLTLVIGL